jgi:S-adenosylmethionine decarboxylase
VPKPIPRLKLHGFNNLTKSLSFNIYDICYTQTLEQRREYIAYIDNIYNAERLTEILANVSDIIGATVLNVARQDYEPQGASVTMLIAEAPLGTVPAGTGAATPGPIPDSVVAHLDKSHITVHTYPDSHPEAEISTFRADIDVSTCGLISPLKALNYLIHSFESDIVITDYRVRGFTRDVRGLKHFIDHKINSIQNFLSKDARDKYRTIDVNVYQENIFHTKMIRGDFDLDDYLFGIDKADLPPRQRRDIERRLRREMAEIFYSQTLTRGIEV